jgi:hypothetical protein
MAQNAAIARAKSSRTMPKPFIFKGSAGTGRKA